MNLSGKLKKAWNLIKSLKWRTFIERTRQNIKQAVVNSKKGKSFIYRTKMGFNFICIPTSAQSVHSYISGWGEEIELKSACNWLLKGDSCLDIGANVGYYSAGFAEKVTTSGNVISAEASPKTAKHLEEMVRTLSLKQIHPENVCITDTEGHTDFMVSLDTPHEHFQSIRISREEEKFYKKETIRTDTVDNLIRKYGIGKEVSLVKIDIEGAEPLALSGSSLLFNKEALPLFIAEITRDSLSQFGFGPDDIMNFFPPGSFEIYCVFFGKKPGTRLLRRLETSSIFNWPVHTNIIALPKIGKYAARKKRIEKYLSS
ncbi:MAG: FkbM family methyltransferase [Candidatus Omnitrophota bacterium]